MAVGRDFPMHTLMVSTYMGYPGGVYMCVYHMLTVKYVYGHMWSNFLHPYC